MKFKFELQGRAGTVTVVSKSAGTDTGPGPAAGSHVPKIQLEA